VIGFAESPRECLGITLTYTSGPHGSISGAAVQNIFMYEDGSTVVAAAANGYTFAGWSDGNMSPIRRDTNVTSDITVSAAFVVSSVSWDTFCILYSAHLISSNAEDVLKIGPGPSTSVTTETQYAGAWVLNDPNACPQVVWIGWPDYLLARSVSNPNETKVYYKESASWSRAPNYTLACQVNLYKNQYETTHSYLRLDG
jgi:hypothetical protein